MEGTFRTCDKESRDLVSRRLKEIAESTANAYGATVEIELEKGPPSTNNDKELAQFCNKICQELNLKSIYTEPTAVGEDFAYYQEELKGIMIWLGVGALSSSIIYSEQISLLPKFILKILKRSTSTCSFC